MNHTNNPTSLPKMILKYIKITFTQSHDVSQTLNAMTSTMTSTMTSCNVVGTEIFYWDFVMSTFYIEYPVERRTGRRTDWHLSVVKVIRDRARAAELEQPQISLSRRFHHILVVVIIANDRDGACWSQHANDTTINHCGITIGKLLPLYNDYITQHGCCGFARRRRRWSLRPTGVAHAITAACCCIPYLIVASQWHCYSHFFFLLSYRSLIVAHVGVGRFCRLERRWKSVFRHCHHHREAKWWYLKHYGGYGADHCFIGSRIKFYTKEDSWNFIIQLLKNVAIDKSHF